MAHISMLFRVACTINFLKQIEKNYGVVKNKAIIFIDNKHRHGDQKAMFFNTKKRNECSFRIVMEVFPCFYSNRSPGILY